MVLLSGSLDGDLIGKDLNWDYGKVAIEIRVTYLEVSGLCGTVIQWKLMWG